jgi:hypothetical protein
LQSQALDVMRSGFVVEMGDEEEYGDFSTFQQAILAATCNVTATANSMSVAYTNGVDALFAAWSPSATTFLVGGVSPYPSADVWRDSSLTQMSKGTRLEKNGAVMERTAAAGSWRDVLLLQTFPQQGIYVAMNPLPNYQAYTFETPDGVKIEANGKLSMGRWAVTGTSEIDIRFCEFEDEYAIPQEERATMLFVTGMPARPTVILNGKNITHKVAATTKNGVNGWRILLYEKEDALLILLR